MTKVLQLDKNFCYFAKNFEYSSKCYVAFPMSSDNKGYFFVVDLNKNGLQINYNKAAIIRDYFNRDSYQLDGWFGANDGIFVIEKSKIAEVLESLDSSESNYFRYYNTLSGFFRAFDYDKNNVLDVRDINFKHISVWRDANQDMICQDEEVSSLAELGIKSINLADYESSYDTCPFHNLKRDGQISCLGENGEEMPIYNMKLLHYV